VCAQQDTHKEVQCQGKAEVGAVVEAAEVVEAEVDAEVDAEVEVAGVATVRKAQGQVQGKDQFSKKCVYHHGIILG